MKRLFLAAALWLIGSLPAGAVGFQWATAPNPDDAPLQVAIWYPSDGATAVRMIGPYDMDVAQDGAVQAGRHPLIVMSHGTGGMPLNSYDTAMALANAGFIVASVSHTGDNYRDQSYAFTRRNFTDRPKHISRVIDFMVAGWAGHTSIDAARIGVVGHSAGGATALLVAGGVMDLQPVADFCRDNQTDWGCVRARNRGPVPVETTTGPVSGRDERVKAIVIGAPALTMAFTSAGLAAVKVPVQLWVGAEDAVVTDAWKLPGMLAAPVEYHLVPRAGHFAFLTPCNDLLLRAAPEICADPAGFDRSAFLGGFQEAVVGFFRTSLK